MQESLTRQTSVSVQALVSMQPDHARPNRDVISQKMAGYMGYREIYTYRSISFLIPGSDGRRCSPYAVEYRIFWLHEEKVDADGKTNVQKHGYVAMIFSEFLLVDVRAEGYGKYAQEASKGELHDRE